ncbi:type II secretion system secretin GspD [Pseudohongiella sp.]|uniref:NolW-like domain-containing protein n=1 Tax=marine sediment metagenome TaxID=412755 RepID=A0A0F9VUR1_9ZZZZ|nr:type II secretion system secretin GspD [Pseudohongiella sp.]HDZ08710.1 type II secretion system protein GspD [Pseudohongiella sp.]HEA62326.1 type II secretion system protein GspD [Pseudohongiella sp.]
MKGNIRPIALLGFAVALSSCASMQTDNGSQSQRTAPPARTTAMTAASSDSAQSTADLSARQRAEAADAAERQALIAQINRDGEPLSADGYREAVPLPTQAPAQDIVELNYEQADLRDVLTELADALDITMIIDPTIADLVSIRTAANRPLAYDDIWPLVRLLTRQNGVLLERVGDVYYASKGDSSLPVEITTPDSLQRGSASYVMQITPLTYVSVESALEILTPLVEPDGSVIRISNSNTLAVSASRSQLSRVNELLDLIDDDPFRNQGIQLYPLSNASAGDVAVELQDILLLIEGGSPAFQVQALERINSLLVTAPASRGFDEISRWIRILDADRQEQAEQLFRYQVKNLNATELATTLTEVFRREDDNETVPGNNGQDQEGERGTVVELNEQGQPVFRSQVSANDSGQTVSTVAVSADLRVTIVADDATNTLLIRSNPRDYRQLLAIINQLDTAPLQVMLNAAIAQVVLTDDTAFGVDWSRVLETATGTTRVSTGFLPSRADGGSGLGGLLFNRAFLDGAARVEATLEAIAVNNDVRLLARPSLTVVNNMEGQIRIGAEVPVRLGETTTNVGTTENIQYRDTGIELNITPRINGEGVINLVIRQSLSSVSEASGVSGNPIFENQEIETTVVVRDGENVVLGGLIQNNNDALNTGVPFLNQVPGIGRLFSYTRDNNERRELFIVIRPEIINVNEQTDASYREILSRFELAAEMLSEQN